MVMMCVFLQHKSTFCCHIPTNVPWIVDHHHNSNCITAIVSQLFKTIFIHLVVGHCRQLYQISYCVITTTVFQYYVYYRVKWLQYHSLSQCSASITETVHVQRAIFHRRWSSVIPILYYHNNSIPVLHVLQSKIITASQYYRNSSILHRRWSYSVIL